MRIITLILSFSLFANLHPYLKAQTAHNLNVGITGRFCNAVVLADASYNTTSINIPFKDVTYGVGTPFGQMIVNSSSNSAIDIMLQAFQGYQTNSIVIAGAQYLTAVYTSYNAIYGIGTGLNTQYRIYQFYLPVQTIWIINVALIGDIDNTHNKIDLYNSSTPVWSTNEYLDSNSNKSYSLYLQPGQYFLMVSLGSGSGVIHSAGSLNSVNSSGPVSWTDTNIILSEFRTPFKSVVPIIGSTATLSVSVPDSILPGIPYSSPIGVGTVIYSNFHALNDGIYLSVMGLPDYKIDQIYQTGGSVWLPNYRSTLVSFNGRTAYYSITRDEDELLDWIY